MTNATNGHSLTRQDFISDQEVRWCPGCGDYAILAQMQRTLPEIGVPKENIVFVSGIGCSSRFPYYMNTYGIHSIHGRAPTLATGLKAANPDLSVWVITGDGDALSIGGNHLLHACRRNADLNIILFNNRIYGLTKGQYSPTSKVGHVTKSSPFGSIEQPLNPISVALGAEATFIGRSVDVHGKHLQDMLLAAAAHNGTSFLEVFQNCLIFNDGAFQEVTDRRIRDDHALELVHGQPMIFGREGNKGIRLEGLGPVVVEWAPDEQPPEDILVHDESDRFLTYLLGQMQPPEFPYPLGVMRRVSAPAYNEGLIGQVEQARAKNGPGDLRKLFFGTETWTVDVDLESANTAEIEGGGIVGLDEQYIEEIDRNDLEPSEMEHNLESDSLAELQPHEPIAVTRGTSLSDVIARMRAENIGSVMVVGSEGRLEGVFTEWDVLNRVAGAVTDLKAALVDDYMTPNPTALERDDPIAHALHLMAVHRFRHLPLVDSDRRPVGLVSFRDVVVYIQKYFA